MSQRGQKPAAPRPPGLAVADVLVVAPIDLGSKAGGRQCGPKVWAEAWLRVGAMLTSGTVGWSFAA